MFDLIIGAIIGFILGWIACAVFDESRPAFFAWVRAKWNQLRGRE